MTMSRIFWKKYDQNRPFGGGFLLRLHQVQKAVNVSGDSLLPLARSAKAANVSGDPPLPLARSAKAANVSGDSPPVFLDFPHLLCYNENNSSKSDALIFFEK